MNSAAKIDVACVNRFATPRAENMLDELPPPISAEPPSLFCSKITPIMDNVIIICKVKSTAILVLSHIKLELIVNNSKLLVLES